MNAVVKQKLPAFGTPMAGGFLTGTVMVNGEELGIIAAPKAEGQRERGPWNESEDSVEGALSYDDSMANTKAMAAAGSELAQWAIDLRIGGFDDWCIPAQDVLEVQHRNMKPGTDKNWCYGRSGINLSAVPPTRPYTPDFPVQTEVEAFKDDGAEAFDEAWYWSSTQHAGSSDSAWAQGFEDGDQGNYDKGNHCRARAVRLIKL